MSRLERRTDMYLSTLRNLIVSMGGTLRIIAQFPDRPPVCINQFEALDEFGEDDSREIPVDERALSATARAKKIHSDDFLRQGSGKNSKRALLRPARPAAKRGKKR